METLDLLNYKYDTVVLLKTNLILNTFWGKCQILPHVITFLNLFKFWNLIYEYLLLFNDVDFWL